MTAFSVVVMAKSPVPGRVKTRLRPHFSDQEAADLAAAALTDSLPTAAADNLGSSSRSTGVGHRRHRVNLPASR